MGNAKVARAGRLTLAVSGPEETFKQAKPYLDLLGAGATYVGEGKPPGSSSFAITSCWGS